jgi:hypothetical protein
MKELEERISSTYRIKKRKTKNISLDTMRFKEQNNDKKEEKENKRNVQNKSKSKNIRVNNFTDNK